jgi:hypothetical protein
VGKKVTPWQGKLFLDIYKNKFVIYFYDQYLYYFYYVLGEKIRLPNLIVKKS